MARIPVLSFDRGTLILHPPPRAKSWMDFATWDDRIEKFRIPALRYTELLAGLHLEKSSVNNQAKNYTGLELEASLPLTPYPHQQEALQAWQAAGKRGVVVLPTAAGKTYLALMAMQTTPYSTLIVVPTLDLMHQWYTRLLATFPQAEVGLLGGGSRDQTPILVATYDSAAIQAESLGNRYGLVIFDECHHLPTDFNRVIAEFTIAPYRLGLTATPDRTDGKHQDLELLIGAEVYRRRAEDLTGGALADYRTEQILVKLTPQEREEYSQLLKIRNEFLQQSKIFLGSLDGWQQFVLASSRSPAGRRAMLAHRRSKEIAFGTEGKIQALIKILGEHYPAQTLIFTTDNATVYRISQELLIPALTHQTPVKERHEILDKFRQGEYKVLVTSHVLNEGVDVPEASIAVILSGTGSEREYIQRLGRILRRSSDINKQAILYEVVAEQTVEEGTSSRRKGSPPKTDFSGTVNSPAKQPKLKQLELLPSPPLPPSTSPYLPVPPSPRKIAAEKSQPWQDDDEF